ncbi:hypothetical protein DFH11DRAFT_1880939 [Phellopilus nigrolimitatus]|nr:hypothetical protein DFH11DRAFT_1880939 [Phellopilus nigrolimitatus]
MAATTPPPTYTLPSVRYGVPPPGQASSSLGPPLPDPASDSVLYFSAAGAAIPRGADVRDRTGRTRFRLSSAGPGQMSLADAATGADLARVERGRVFYGDAEHPVKATRFVARNTPGNTGPVLTHDGQTYEWVQEIFYALVRTTPGAERVAVIYNYKRNPVVEMLPAGQRVPGLEAHILFAAALIESKVASEKRVGAGAGGGVARALRGVLPGKNKSITA